MVRAQLAENEVVDRAIAAAALQPRHGDMPAPIQMHLGERQPLRRNLVQALAADRQPAADFRQQTDQIVQALRAGAPLHQTVVQIVRAERHVDEAAGDGILLGRPAPSGGTARCAT